MVEYSESTKTLSNATKERMLSVGAMEDCDSDASPCMSRHLAFLPAKIYLADR